MTDTDMRRGFAAVRADKADPSLKDLPNDMLRQFLALHMHVHQGDYCDADGYFEGSKLPGSSVPLRQFAAGRFGLEDMPLKRFMDGLTKSGLFETNGQRGVRCQYRLVANAEFDGLLEQYKAFVADATMPEPPAHTSEGSNLVIQPDGPGATQKWTAAEAAAQRVVDTDPPPPSLPVDVKDRVLAIMLAKQFLNTPLDDNGHTLKDDPALLNQVAQALIVESWNLK